MSRDHSITIYVSADEKTHLQQEADQANETLSSYLYKLIQQQRAQEGRARAATELNAEQRIEALLAEGTERLEEIAADIRDVNARAGAYSVANFELLKQNYPDARRQEVLETGSRRLRYPLEEHTDLHADAADGSTDEHTQETADRPTEVDDLL